MRRRAAVLIAGGLGLLVSCGRTGLGLPDNDFADGGFDAGDDDDGFDDGTFVEPDPDPEIPPEEVDPPLDESCGNGIAEPGELCFMPEITFWSRIDPCALDIGDIDGDGHLDVATPNSDFDHVETSLNLTSVLYGNGLGQLSEPVPYITGDEIPVGVRLGDLNLDGRLDVVSVNSDAGTMSVLVNLGQQQMADAGRVSAGIGPVIADVGDVNGDDVLDLAVTSENEVRIAIGRGDGNFEAPYSISFPGSLWAVRLADLNGDGLTDMAVSNISEAAVQLWFGDGTGQMTPGDRLAMIGVPLGITSTDVNADGVLDLLVAHSFSVAVLLGTGGGSFSEVDQIAAGIDPRDTAMADFDNDGRLDAAVVNSTSQDISLALGRGDGQFDSAATYSVGTLPSGIEAGDFNTDGVPDMVVSNQLSNTIGLVLSNP